MVYNEKTGEVHRLDGIGQSCVLLPGDQGILFANGYMLVTGAVKTYETGRSGLRFERRIAAGNGEDTLFVFYQRTTGHYVLFSYNVIAQTVETPVVCNGFALDPDGRMVLFQAPEQAQKHHALQVWRTPYVVDSSTAVPAAKRDSLLFKIGNSALVRGMAEAREILILLGKGDTYADVYLELVRRSREVLDGYFWLKEKEACQLSEPLEAIHAAANAAIDEFDKVVRLATSDCRADRGGACHHRSASQGGAAQCAGRHPRICPASGGSAPAPGGNHRAARVEILGQRADR